MALLIFNIVTFQFSEVWDSVVLAMSAEKAGVIVAGFVAAGLLMIYADSRMSTVFSQFWHRHHSELREALKEARRIVRDLTTGKDTRIAANIRNNTEIKLAPTTEDQVHERTNGLADISQPC
jgi:hypothetical protein